MITCKVSSVTEVYTTRMICVRQKMKQAHWLISQSFWKKRTLNWIWEGKYEFTRKAKSTYQSKTKIKIMCPKSSEYSIECTENRQEKKEREEEWEGVGFLGNYKLVGGRSGCRQICEVMRHSWGFEERANDWKFCS